MLMPYITEWHCPYAFNRGTVTPDFTLREGHANALARR